MIENRGGCSFRQLAVRRKSGLRGLKIGGLMDLDCALPTGLAKGSTLSGGGTTAVDGAGG